jgi:transcriptional regulator with XRE-family HTH domain
MLDIRVALYQRIQDMPFAFFTREKLGATVSHVVNDVQRVGDVISATLADIVQNTVVLSATIAFMIALDWRLALAAVAGLPLFIAPARRVGEARKAIKRKTQARTKRAHRDRHRNAVGLRRLLVRVFGTAAAEMTRFRSKAEELRRLALEQSLVGRWFRMPLGVCESAGPAMVFALGGWLVVRRQVPLGTVVALVTVMKRLYTPASDLLARDGRYAWLWRTQMRRDTTRFSLLASVPPFLCVFTVFSVASVVSPCQLKRLLAEQYASNRLHRPCMSRIVPTADEYDVTGRTAVGDGFRARCVDAARAQPSSSAPGSRGGERAMADVESDRTLILSPGQKFGRRLREQRERERVTLDAIAASTKIKKSLLTGLERGDVSGWPAGIFRRAFVREYARAIGLPPEPAVTEFVRIFEDANKSESKTEIEQTPADGLRLRLEDEPQELRSLAGPICAGLTEGAGLALIALAAAWITTASFASACAAVLLLYYPIATACVGCTPAAWLLKRNLASPARRHAPDPSAAAAERREGLYLVKPAADADRPDAVTEHDDVDSDPPLRRSAAR